VTIPENIQKHQKLSQYSQDIAHLSQCSTLFILEIYGKLLLCLWIFI